ncbi:MAG: hypothetical protein LJE94_15435 [Deltaproteobacteria bacterium]|jgi:hypothetical protein|nr:hypothetical protein [Deltaproteobacteria bacterium]
MNRIEAKHLPNADDLAQLFKTHPGERTINFKGKCAVCNQKLTVEISATAGGFGFNGGVLLGTGREAPFFGCLKCIRSATTIRTHAYRS